MQALSDPLILIILFLNVILMAVVVAIFFRVEKMHRDILRGEHLDRHAQHKISKKIGEETDAVLESSIKSAISAVEEEARKQSGQILNDASAQTKKLIEFIQEQQVAVVKESQLTIANSILKTEGQLEKYKQEQIEKINHEITAIVFSAAREVLGRAISLAEHEDLVVQALERAKRDKFFI